MQCSLKQVKHSTEFFPFINQSPSFNSKQIDKQISSALIILKLPYFAKTIREKLKFYKFLVRGIMKLICHSRIMNP